MTLSFKVHVLDGPDFLDAVADAEEGLGNLINAAEYRRRARQWRNDLDLIGRHLGRGEVEHHALA